MCRGSVSAPPQAQVLERLQQRLQEQLSLNGAPLGLCGAGDPLAHAASRGSGPRLFCGHVPPECSEELVKAHFSQWGHVVDVYFPKRKDTFRRRPFCFVTFNRLEDAQRALAESPMNICGIPIKQLNLVEDRADYYKHRHTAAQSALVQALQTLALLGNDGGAAAAAAAAAPALAAAQAPAAGPAMDLNNLAALLSLDSTGAQLSAAGAARPQAAYPQMAPQMGGYEAPSAYGSGSLPFANLPGFSQAAMTAGQPAAGLAMPAAAPSYGVPSQPAFPPSSAAALAAALSAPAPGCRMSAGDWQLPGGAVSPFSTLEGMAHASASSSPPRSELPLAAALPLARSAGTARSSSDGSASPDLDAAAANRLAMWQLQNELLAGEGSSGSAGDWPGAGARALAAN